MQVLKALPKAPDLLQIGGLYSSVAERQSCKLKVLGSIPSGGLLLLSLALVAPDSTKFQEGAQRKL